MTVAELIARLRELPEDAIVVTRDYNAQYIGGSLEPIQNVELSEKWLAGKDRVIVWP